MTALVAASERDLCTLAGMVSDYRTDLPAQGLPASLLSDLMTCIRCDAILFEGFDSDQQKTWSAQSLPVEDDAADQGYAQAHWTHYWDCQPCSYPDRTGDLRSIIKIADFYSARQWHSTGMYSDLYQPQGVEHELMLTLPAGCGKPPGPRRTLRLFLFRGRVLTSRRPTAPCSRCCGHTCTRPTSTPNAAVIPSPSSPGGTGSCWTWSRTG
jgi:hypothetical protein